MKQIPLTKGQFAIIDDEDFEWLNQWNWCLHTTKNGEMRAERRQGKKIIYMHRQIVNAPNKMYVDHHNGKTLDNQKSNLRICTPSQNNQNRRPGKGKTSWYKGVFLSTEQWRKKRWTAQVGYNGKDYNLGRFKTEKEAAKMYNMVAEVLFGEFALLNLVEE